MLSINCETVSTMLFPMKTARSRSLEYVRILASPLILTNPIMDIAARVWDDERYAAAKICYQSMRVIDDLIDNQKAAVGGVQEAARERLTAAVAAWVDTITAGAAPAAPHRDLVRVIRRFKIPLWPWQVWSESMLYDITHRGFKTLPAFLQYAEGASVAPASIFLHFCGLAETSQGYVGPRFDVRRAARPAGLFCYFVHIVRDFQEDQHHNLNYFAQSVIAESGSHPSELKAVANGGAITAGFRRLMKNYHALAEHYRGLTRWEIDRVSRFLEPRYRLSLEIVYNLYLLVFERIDVVNGRFTTAELSPPPEEIETRLDSTIASFESKMYAY